MKKQTNHSAVFALVLFAFVFGLFMPWSPMSANQSMHEGMSDHAEMTMEDMGEHREHFVDQKGDMIKKMIAEGKYRCCLEKPCSYCIEKTPGHGEGATCDCLADIVAGKHPCGECIGEILEGHGNKYLVDYFPVAIAEEVGMQHLETIIQIIAEKYGTESVDAH